MKYFLFTVRRVCRVKRFSLGGKRFADDEEVETEVRKWLKQKSKDFYSAGFDALVKRWISVSMLVEDMSRNKCFFFRFEYHMFYVLYPFVTYLLTVPHIFNCCNYHHHYWPHCTYFTAIHFIRPIL
jgi:hypothetical protein